jgi:hypothetical protein
VLPPTVDGISIAQLFEKEALVFVSVIVIVSVVPL